MEKVLGFDNHNKEIVFWGNDENGDCFCKGKLETSLAGLRELRDRYQIPEGTKIGMETGTQAYFVARNLVNLGYVPVIIHATEVRRRKARPKQKDDMRDAREICHGVQKGIYEQIVRVPAAKYRKLRETLSARRHFINARSDEIRVAKHGLRRAGLRGMCKTLTSKKTWEKLIEKLIDAEEEEIANRVRCHFAVWKINQDQVLQLDQEIDQLLEENPEMMEAIEILKSAPGVGKIVALTVVAVLADVHRFQNAKQASCYSGLITETDHSADKKKFGHITKEGSPELRTMLVEAAHHAAKPHHPLNPFFRKIRAKKGYKVAIVAAAHRLCRILYAMLRDLTTFDANKTVSKKQAQKVYVLN